jgi:hypothetical protein
MDATVVKFTRWQEQRSIPFTPAFSYSIQEYDAKKGNYQGIWLLNLEIDSSTFSNEYDTR